MTEPTWKSRLDGRLEPQLAEEIDVFETQMDLRRRGRLEEKIFAESRLRRGVYGQRYDNGKRHDGVASRELAFPCGSLTKGPETAWDAPGMVRIKIPMGRLSAAQLDCLAELAEEYSDQILHVTTRQDIQLHFVHIEDTPPLMRRLGAVGITTREACGNAVRNVTACQYAGVCAGAPFDVTPYANAITYYLLGHRDTQDFGRKFKISFSGCKGEACGLANFHDLGAIAVTRIVGDTVERGFEFYVGGGLGAVPHMAKLLSEFVPESEMLPVAQAVCRVFARLGEKENRAKARLKFVIQKLGIDEFRRVVAEERKSIPHDEEWTTYLADLSVTDDSPAHPPAALGPGSWGVAFDKWRKHNVRPQSQAGYVTATIRTPLGDFTADQARAVSDLARKYTGDTIRLSVDQNLCLRWVPEAELPDLFAELEGVELAQAGANTIADITACPGTDTCKLGISASRGLARVLEERLSVASHPVQVEKLHIKASGCFNSCAQHHVADIGFLGVSRMVGGRRVSHFQLVVGGEWKNNGGAYGLAIGAYPAKRIPALVDKLTGLWVSERDGAESFREFVQRFGRAGLKKHMEEFRPVPAYEDDPSFYVDWGDVREYTIGDMGVGECAGEVVSLAEFGLSDSERKVFEAQLKLEGGDAAEAAKYGYDAMLVAARALVRTRNLDVKEDADAIVGDFRVLFHETKDFHDPFAGAKFANYLFNAHANPPSDDSHEEAHRQIEEAQLFIEAAHNCLQRMQG